MTRERTLLTAEQVTELQVAYDQCRDGKTKIRFLAVRLYGTGKPCQEVLAIVGCSRSSLMGWLRGYRAWGIAGLVDKRAGGNSAKLTPPEIEQLQVQLHSYSPEQLLGPEASGAPFWTVDNLVRLLERDYQVVYQSPTSLRSLLKRCGLSRQRPAKQYKSRSEETVMDFEEALEKN